MDLGHPTGPVLHLGEHDADLATGERRADRPVIERGQPRGGELLQRGHLGCHRGEQQGLREPVVGAEPGRDRARVAVGGGLGQAVRGEQKGPQLLLV